MAVIGTRLRVSALRLGFRTIFGLPRVVKRTLAGAQVRVEDQGLDLDVQLLYRLGDDSKTYYWRVLASRDVMRLYRDDRAKLERLVELQSGADSGELVLHPVPGDDAERAGTDQAQHHPPPKRGTIPVGARFASLAAARTRAPPACPADRFAARWRPSAWKP